MKYLNLTVRIQKNEGRPDILEDKYDKFMDSHPEIKKYLPYRKRLAQNINQSVLLQRTSHSGSLSLQPQPNLLSIFILSSKNSQGSYIKFKRNSINLLLVWRKFRVVYQR